jgi:hypothetical protein
MGVFLLFSKEDDAGDSKAASFSVADFEHPDHAMRPG